jgi:hypothetical protein
MPIRAFTDKIGFTSEGGLAVKLQNMTGSGSVAGYVVRSNSSSGSSVSLIGQDVPDPIGVIYETGIANGADMWVVVHGIASVMFIGSTTSGHMARGFVTADAGYIAGYALSEAVPASPFATDKHFYEIGHVIETRTGRGLAKVILHYN